MVKELKANRTATDLIPLIKPGFDSGVNEQPTSRISGSYGTSANLKVHLRFMIAVRYERGVYLPRQELWLDPWDAKRFAFVSHAHADHIMGLDDVRRFNVTRSGPLDAWADDATFKSLGRIFECGLRVRAIKSEARCQRLSEPLRILRAQAGGPRLSHS